MHKSAWVLGVEILLIRSFGLAKPRCMRKMCQIFIGLEEY
jgi:hypothetical protein